MKSEEQQQADICCREGTRRVQCEHCLSYADPDIAQHILLCEACQNKLGRYSRLLLALQSIWAQADPDHGCNVILSEIRKDVEAALKFCGERL